MATGMRRIAILRALKLGDLMCTVPAFRALRAAYPFAEIRLIGLPWASEFVRRYDAYLDGLFELPGFPGFPERPFDARAFPGFLDQVQQWAPDLVVQMHGSGELANPLAVLLGGQMTAGFYRPGAYCPDPERFIPYPDHLPEVGRHLTLLERLGVEPRGRHKDLPIHEGDRHALAEIVPYLAPAGAYVVVHPGASVPERRWPPERFATVADALARTGLVVVLTGSDSEADVTATVRRAMRAPALDLTGQTALGTLAALLAGAALLVSNDTGVMHVAEAVGTPLVAISFDPEGWRWAPHDVERFRVLPGGAAVPVDALLESAGEQLCRRTGGLCAAGAPAGRTPDDPGAQPERG
jgi:ADP-heptose:LPS heptosyltransferase